MKIATWIIAFAALISADPQTTVQDFFSSSQHTNNWAVLVCTSRYWFNYRHVANTLSMYRTVKRLGIPDSQIILMLAEDVACDARNVFPGTVFNNAAKSLDLYGDSVEVDYRGYQVTVENFIRLLTNRHDPSVPRSRKLLTDDRSNIFVFMTGHGGDEFLKFQDAEEISSHDVADAFAQMWEKKRYNEILFMIDTCQANTMYTKFYSPNIIASGSSAKGQNSYSHHTDSDIGVAVIDRYTYYNLEYLERVGQGSKETLKRLFDSFQPAWMGSDPGVREDLIKRETREMLITDFMGSVQNIQWTSEPYPLEGVTEVLAVVQPTVATVYTANAQVEPSAQLLTPTSSMLPSTIMWTLFIGLIIK